MAKIVISYRRADSDVFAGRVHDRIVSRFGDQSAFIDVDNIPFGKDFRVHIQQELAKADALLVIVGPKWLGPTKGGRSRIMDATDPVRIEVETALGRGIPTIPILVGGTSMPKPAQLPETLKDFAFLNAAPVDTSRDFHRDLNRVIATIDQILHLPLDRTDDREQAEAKARQQAEEEARRLEAEAKRKAEEEQQRRQAEARARQQAEEEARRVEAERRAEEERKRAESQAKLEAEARRKAAEEAEARRKAEEERKQQEVAAQRQAEAEAKRRAEEEARQRAEEEERRKREAEIEQRRKEEAEAKRRAEEEERRKHEAEEQRDAGVTWSESFEAEFPKESPSHGYRYQVEGDGSITAISAQGRRVAFRNWAIFSDADNDLLKKRGQDARVTWSESFEAEFPKESPSHGYRYQVEGDGSIAAISVQGRRVAFRNWASFSDADNDLLKKRGQTEVAAQRQAEVERQRPEAEAKRKAEEEQQQRQAEAKAGQQAEEQARRLEAEAKQKAEEEQQRRQAEAKARQQAEEEARRLEAEAAKRKAEEQESQRTVRRLRVEAQQAFEQAKRDDSIIAIENFIAAYPESHRTPEARKLYANLLAREQAHREAVSKGDAAALRAFLKIYPNGALADDAAKRLISVEPKRPAQRALMVGALLLATLVGAMLLIPVVEPTSVPTGPAETTPAQTTPAQPTPAQTAPLKQHPLKQHPLKQHPLQERPSHRRLSLFRRIRLRRHQ
jgi:hypothetical protein